MRILLLVLLLAVSLVYRHCVALGQEAGEGTKLPEGATASLQGSVDDIIEKGKAAGIDPVVIINALRESLPAEQHADLDRRLKEIQEAEKEEEKEEEIRKDQDVQLEMLKKKTLYNIKHPRDTPFVTCEACKALVNRAHSLVQKWRDEHKQTKLRELDVSGMIDKICKEETPEGDWIRELAVVESDDLKSNPKLTLKKMPYKGYCEEGCWVLEEACYNILDASETDLIEQLWRGKTIPQLEKLVCGDNLQDLPGGCGQDYPEMIEKRKNERRPYPFRTPAQVLRDAKKAAKNSEL